jgi:hypothetical protein
VHDPSMEYGLLPYDLYPFLVYAVDLAVCVSTHGTVVDGDTTIVPELETEVAVNVLHEAEGSVGLEASHGGDSLFGFRVDGNDGDGTTGVLEHTNVVVFGNFRGNVDGAIDGEIHSVKPFLGM